MSEDPKMSENTKLIYAVVGVFVAGFILVGISKQQPSQEQREGVAMIKNYNNLQTMANQKCPDAIKEATKEQVYFPSATESDRETYLTLKWAGENVKTGGFKTASCTINSKLGGISELKVDDKVIISKKIPE
jgi:hypothetical protein